MKKSCISLALVVFILIVSFFPSCGLWYPYQDLEPFFAAGGGTALFVDTGTTALRDGVNGFKLDVGVKNPESEYDRAHLIIYSDNVFEVVGIGSGETVVIRYDNLRAPEFIDGKYKNYTIKLKDPGRIDGYRRGAISFELKLYKNGESYTSDPQTELVYIPYVSDGENVVFFNHYDTYADAVERLPGYNAPLSVFSDTPMNSYPYPYVICQFATDCIGVLATVESLEPIPVDDSFSIVVGAGICRTDIVDGSMTVLAEGFSISNESGSSTEDQYVREFTDFNAYNFGFSNGLIDGVYTAPSFDWSEELSFALVDKTERSGKIEIIVKGERAGENGYYPGWDSVSVYYATDGEHIAYSVQSEDAAKLALYGDHG